MNLSEELIAAVKARETARVQALLEQEPTLAHTPTGDGSLLLTAVFWGARDTAELIRARRSDLNAWEAACVGDVARLQTILDAEPEVVNTYVDGRPPLHLAAFFNQPEAARLLLDRGADSDAMSRSTVPFIPANTALHAALAGQAWAVAHLLLERGADIHGTDSAGLTPLHHAAHNGNQEIVALLLTRGVAVNPRDKQGQTPVTKALRQGHPEVAELLRQHGGEE